MVMRRHFRTASGFNFLELIFVIAVIVVIVAIIINVLLSQIGTAEQTGAQKTTESFAVAILNFYQDTQTWPIWEDGTKTGPNDRATKYLVSSSGDFPDVGTTKYDFTPGKGKNPPPTTDTIRNQLMDNAPGYPVTDPKRAWRGPYLSKDPTDPWGRKYVVNVETLKPGLTMRDVLVLSAGPDGVIQTKLNQDPGSFVRGGDDIVYHVR